MIACQHAPAVLASIPERAATTQSRRHFLSLVSSEVAGTEPHKSKCRLTAQLLLLTTNNIELLAELAGGHQEGHQSQSCLPAQRIAPDQWHRLCCVPSQG